MQPVFVYWKCKVLWNYHLESFAIKYYNNKMLSADGVVLHCDLISKFAFENKYIIFVCCVY